MEYVEPFPQKNNRRLFSWIIFGVILLGLAIVVAFVVPAFNNPKDAVTAQLDLIKQGQIEKAYTQTSAEYQSASSLDVFKQVAETVPAISDNKSLEFVSTNNVKQDGMTLAVVKTKMTSNSDVAYDVEYVMKKDSSGWKLWSLNITI